MKRDTGNALAGMVNQLVCEPSTRLVLDHYLGQLQQRSPSAIDRYQRTLKRFFEHLITSRRAIETLDAAALECYASERYASATVAISANVSPQGLESASDGGRHEQLDPGLCQQAQERVNHEFDVINAFIRSLIESGSIQCAPGLLGFRYRRPNAKVTAKAAPLPLADDKWFPTPLWQRLHSDIQAALASAMTDATYLYFQLWQYRITIIYGLGLRVSEAIGHTYAHLAETQAVLVLTVIGKDGKRREISVDRETHEAMASYLRMLRLDLTTAKLYQLPLIPGRGPTRSPSRHSLYVSFQTLQERLKWSSSERRELFALRHTRGMHLAAVLDVTQLMAFLGISRAETAHIYFHNREVVIDQINRLQQPCA